MRVFPAGVWPKFVHFPYLRAPAPPQAHLTAHSLGSLLPPGCSALGGGHRPSLSHAGPGGIIAPPLAPHSLTRGHKAVIVLLTTVCLGRGVWYTGSPGNLWCPNQGHLGLFPWGLDPCWPLEGCRWLPGCPAPVFHHHLPTSVGHLLILCTRPTAA